MSKTIAVGFAGSGEVRSLTVESLLNDWLGFGAKDAEGYFAASENAVEVFFPASASHHNEHLQKVVDWSGWADLPYTAILQKNDRDDSIETLVEDAAVVEEVANVNKALVDALVESKAEEKYLVLLWGEEGDEESETLVDLAELKGIPVKDLTEGLDDIQFAEPEAEPEPEPESEKPVRGRRGSRTQEEEPEVEEKPKRGRRGRVEETPEDEPLTDDDVETKDEPEGFSKEDTFPPKAEAAAEPASWSAAGAGHVAAVEIPEVIGRALRHAYTFHHLVDESNAIKNVSEDVRLSPLTLLLQEALSALHSLVGVPQSDEPGETVSEAPSAPAESEKPRRGRPRVNEPKEGYLLNEEQGTYRKAGRGRPRRGEVKVDLTAAEVERFAEMGILDSE